MANYFVDREVEHPGRVTISPVNSNIMTASIDSDGVASFSNSGAGLVADLTRAEGTVTVAGTPLDALHLNAGVKELMGNSVFGFKITGYLTSSSSIPVEVGKEYIVIWRAHGSSGSAGIDYVWMDSDNMPVARNIMLDGTQLVSYNGSVDGTTWEIVNTSQSTTVHCTVIAQFPTIII